MDVNTSPALIAALVLQLLAMRVIANAHNYGPEYSVTWLYATKGLVVITESVNSTPTLLPDMSVTVTPVRYYQ